MFNVLKFMTYGSMLCYPEGGDAGGAGGGQGAGGDTGGGQGGQQGATGVQTSIAWLDNPTAEDVAYVAAKGWDKSANPAKDILSSYRHLEKMNGAVAGGKALLLPDENTDQATKDAFFNKLGRPEKVEGYELAEPFAGMNEDLSKELTDLGHQLGLTKTQMQGLHKWNNEATAKVNQAFEDDFKIENAQQVSALKKEWGAAFDQNLQLATEAATKFGITAEQITQLQTVLGYDGVMKFMHKIGAGLGEGNFVTTGGDGSSRGGAGGIMSPDQAQKELSRLSSDQEFMKAWGDPNHPKHKEMVARKSQITAWAYPASK